MREKQVYLALGSNLGDRVENLERAILGLEREQIEVKARSSIYETEPQDVHDQPWFLNMVVECETHLFPVQLLGVLQRIELDLGRVRTGIPPRGPRAIDLDMLLFGNLAIQTEKLEIPHPRMRERRFVLEPLVEIAPHLKDPSTKEPFERMLPKLSGQRVKKFGESGPRAAAPG